MAGLWEFPGGKVEHFEVPEAALVRELAEELSVGVAQTDLTPSCFASASLGARNLLLLLYICRRWEGEPRSEEQQELGWFYIDEMAGLPMPPADLPLIELLRAQLSYAAAAL